RRREGSETSSEGASEAKRLRQQRSGGALRKREENQPYADTTGGRRTFPDAKKATRSGGFFVGKDVQKVRISRQEKLFVQLKSIILLDNDCLEAVSHLCLC
ncbi:MAG: hypothetical protein IJL83_07950, partial [Clostridia bacterium]|nr:hypothetical protein [Clostridia bacterium]